MWNNPIKSFSALFCNSILYSLPAKALWDFSQAVEGEQEGSVAVATQASQEVLRGLQSFLCEGLLRHHSDGVQDEVLQVLSELLVLQELAKWFLRVV